MAYFTKWLSNNTQTSVKLTIAVKTFVNIRFEMQLSFSRAYQFWVFFVWLVFIHIVMNEMIISPIYSIIYVKQIYFFFKSARESIFSMKQLIWFIASTRAILKFQQLFFEINIQMIVSTLYHFPLHAYEMEIAYEPDMSSLFYNNHFYLMWNFQIQPILVPNNSLHTARIKHDFGGVRANSAYCLL